MTQAEIKEKISKIKKALASPATPEAAKSKLEGLLDELELLQEEEKVITKQEKTNDKLEKQADKDIVRLDKLISSPKTSPKVATAVKRGVASAKKKVQEAKAVDKKEREQNRKQIKTAVEKAGSGKRGRPKKAAPKKVVVKRKSKAEVKYSKALRDLNALVNRTAELKALYKAKGVKPVDLERDASRKAKPFGWRLKGKGVYRKPTKAEIKSGDAYYEKRPQKADVSRSTYPKLEDGGMMAKGIYTKADKDLYEYKEHLNKKYGVGFKNSELSEEDFDKLYDLKQKKNDSLAKKYPIENAKKMAKGGFTKNRKGEYRKQTKSEIKNDIKAGAAKKPGWKQSDVTGDWYYEDRPNRTDKSRKLKYDDGGMMAKGGWTKNRKGEYRKQTKSEIKNDIKAGPAKKPGWKTSDVTGDWYYEDRPNRTDKSRKLKY